MITLWSRSSTSRGVGIDDADKTEKVETTGWVVGIPIIVAVIAAGASIQVARVNRDAGLVLERERRETALAVEREKERLFLARPTAPAAQPGN
jgi:hypothetical protein